MLDSFRCSHCTIWMCDNHRKTTHFPPCKKLCVLPLIVTFGGILWSLREYQKNRKSSSLKIRKYWLQQPLSYYTYLLRSFFMLPICCLFSYIINYFRRISDISLAINRHDKMQDCELYWQPFIAHVMKLLCVNVFIGMFLHCSRDHRRRRSSRFAIDFYFKCCVNSV